MSAAAFSASALRGPARIEINEVSPRDGLQIEPVVVPTDAKVAFLDALSACGFARIEATSFTSAKAIPALADAEALMHRMHRQPGVRYTALVPNLRGLERALSCRPDEVNLVMSVSETHNRANLRMTLAQSQAQLLAMIAEARSAGVPVNVSLSTVFGCPFEGEVSTDAVMALAGSFAEAGAQGITLCDTTGMAYPNQVAQMCEQFRQRLPETGLTIHLHNTRGMGLANAVAAWETGVTRFDAAAGGLGAARMHREPAETSVPRNSCICSPAWAYRPAWTCRRCSMSWPASRHWSSATSVASCCVPARACARTSRQPGWQSISPARTRFLRRERVAGSRGAK